MKDSRQIAMAGDLSLDFCNAEVRLKDRKIGLTAKEFFLLKTLVKANGRVITRGYLLSNIWGFDNVKEIKTRTVDAHIRSLRRKLKSEARRIITIKNFGYRFDNG